MHDPPLPARPEVDLAGRDLVLPRTPPLRHVLAGAVRLEDQVARRAERPVELIGRGRHSTLLLSNLSVNYDGRGRFVKRRETPWSGPGCPGSPRRAQRWRSGRDPGGTLGAARSGPSGGRPRSETGS